GKVRAPQDLVGGIMMLTPFSAWLYVTNVEFRYDSNASALAYARLEGFLPDGRAIREDSTGKLPKSFRVINNLEEVVDPLPSRVCAGGLRPGGQAHPVQR